VHSLACVGVSIQSRCRASRPRTRLVTRRQAWVGLATTGLKSTRQPQLRCLRLNPPTTSSLFLPVVPLQPCHGRVLLKSDRFQHRLVVSCLIPSPSDARLLDALVYLNRACHRQSSSGGRMEPAPRRTNAGHRCFEAGRPEVSIATPNVRAKRATTAGRARQEAKNGAKPQRLMAGVACRWRSA
jgi:hypothetical protein